MEESEKKSKKKLLQTVVLAITVPFLTVFAADSPHFAGACSCATALRAGSP
jgi:hypothetical protein